MITNFKIFENKVVYDTKYYWFIAGGRLDVSRIILKLIKDINYSDTDNYYDNNIADHLSEIVLDMQKKATANDHLNYGLFLHIDNNDHMKYTTITNSTIHQNIISKSKYKYQGEIKLIDDEIVVDKIDVDAKKYNI
jgi:hypothetical protein